MFKEFKKVALIGRRKTSGIPETLAAVSQYLQNKHVPTVLEAQTAELLPNTDLPIIDKDELRKHCSLLIVVGGDGSMLKAARIAINTSLPVLGINRGSLGFLTDIHPDELNRIDDVLAGNYQDEQRFLLDISLEHNGKTLLNTVALNDAVLLPGKVAHLIEFDIAINNQFVCKQRADGLIVATPTGSTAYALSGGGPILHPPLDAMVLVPMLPHTLSNRPVVIDAASTIELTICTKNTITPSISCDGTDRVKAAPGSKILIKKHEKILHLIHPKDYNYFETLRTKLGWQSAR